MTDGEFDLLRAKLERVLHFALTDIRSLALAGGTRQIHDLADAIELVPDYLSRRDERDLEATRGGLHEYADKYGGMARRLIDTLDMDDAEFVALYRRTTWPWPEPVPAAS